MKEETKKDIKAILLWLLAAAIVALLIIPMNRDFKKELPAFMIDTETGEAASTTLVIDGEWVWRNIWPFGVKYEGKIIIEALDYTNKESSEISDIYFRTVRFSEDDIKLKEASWFYSSFGEEDIYGFAGFGALWSDTKLEKFYIHTSPSSNGDSENAYGDKNYVIIAPAENEEEARLIAEEELGIKYPDK